MLRVRGFLLAATYFMPNLLPIGAYAYDSASIARAIPCSTIESMFRGVNPGSFLRTSFVDTYTDVLPADQWTPEAFNNFAGRSISCFAGNAMLRFSAQVGLKAMAASFQETLQHRQEQAEQHRQQKLAAEAKQKLVLRGIDDAIHSAETTPGTADELNGKLDNIRRDLNDPSLTSKDRDAFSSRLAKLAVKLDQLVQQETATFQSQKAARDAQAAAEDAEITKLEELNRQKEAAQTADAAREQRLAAAQSRAAEIEAKQKALAAVDEAFRGTDAADTVDKMNAAVEKLTQVAQDPHLSPADRPQFETRFSALSKKIEMINSRDSDGSTPKEKAHLGLPLNPKNEQSSMNDQSTVSSMFFGDKAQAAKAIIQKNPDEAAIMAAQLYIEKHCPTIEPNELILNSIDQSQSAVKFKAPRSFTNEEKASAEFIVDIMEKKQKEGIIPGSPLDIQIKCSEVGNALIGTGMYKNAD